MIHANLRDGAVFTVAYQTLCGCIYDEASSYILMTGNIPSGFGTSENGR
jgi:hypothetical protein